MLPATRNIVAFLLVVQSAVGVDAGYPRFVWAAKRALAVNAGDTWVSGARTQALLELDFPTLSVYASKPFPQPASPVPVATNSIVAEWDSRRPAGARQFAEIDGGAAGDPASLGIAWIMAQKSANASTRARYQKAVQQELDFLLITQKRTKDGAISTRPTDTEPLQLWNDFVSMVPPFLAYAGATQGNQSLLQEAYNQCLLYRRYLRDPKTGLWKHIMFGDWQDPSLWATGNAWAASGMLRVLSTIRKSQFSKKMRPQQKDLAFWINEIIDGAFKQFDPATGLIPNSLSNKTRFYDASASALLAATALRFAQQGLGANKARLAIAHKIRDSVFKRVDIKTGWMTPVVDPLHWTQQTSKSPEGAAFVLELQAASTDYGRRWISSKAYL